MTAVAGSVFVLLLVLTVFSTSMNDGPLTASTVTYCENPYGIMCECTNRECMEHDPNQEDPLAETCPNIYTGDPCPCIDTTCINHNPNPPEECETPYTNGQSKWGSGEC